MVMQVLKKALNIIKVQQETEHPVEKAIRERREPDADALAEYIAEHKPGTERDMLLRSLPRIQRRLQALHEEQAALPALATLKAEYAKLNAEVMALPNDVDLKVQSRIGVERVPVGELEAWDAARLEKLAPVLAKNNRLRMRCRELNDKIARHSAIPREMENTLNCLPKRAHLLNDFVAVPSLSELYCHLNRLNLLEPMAVTA